jgi:hypothetical protein
VCTRFLINLAGIKLCWFYFEVHTNSKILRGRENKAKSTIFPNWKGSGWESSLYLQTQ